MYKTVLFFSIKRSRRCCVGYPRLGLHVMWKHKSDDAGLWDGLVRGQCTSRNDLVFASGGNATRSGSWGGMDPSSSASSYSVGPGPSGLDQSVLNLNYTTFTAMCYANVAALLLGVSLPHYYYNWHSALIVACPTLSN